MAVDDVSLFSMLKGRMGYLAQRERLIAENVANTDTPGFRPRDLKPYSFAAQLRLQPAMAGVEPARTAVAHLPGSVQRQPASPWKGAKGQDSEVTLDGNAVVLEEQMLKMSEARVNYDAAVGFYQKAMNLLRTAARAPGR